MKTLGLRGLSLGVLWVLAGGCGGDSPTTPTTPPPSFAGTWAGTGQLQQCTGNPTACAPANLNATSPVEFVLVQSGTAVSGTWTINAAEPRIAVTGSVAADGALSLSGRLAGHPAAVDSSRLMVTGATMNGTLVYTVTLPTAAPSSATFTLQLQGVTRR